ncbi:menaquinone-dependent protoporphyrinogen IX dehydrogenase [Kaarinaea lacus]
MNILILYASLEGQTQKIAERIAQELRNKGYQVTNQSAEHLPNNYNSDSFGAVIIGGSIHMGHYPKYLKKFVSSHADWLNSVTSAFFTVCMAIHSQQEKSRQEAITYGDNFIKQTGWQPALTTTFAGAVKYTQYNFITRFIMKRISRREGGSTDTSRDHEYTDWDSVVLFAEEFAEKIANLQDA